MFTSPASPMHYSQFVNQSADETLGPWINAQGFANVSFAVTGTGTTSSGVITFEECQSVSPPTTNPLLPYSATTDSFSVVTTVNASDVTGGKQKVIHFPPNVAYGFVRARISTVIGGTGTITVTAELS